MLIALFVASGLVSTACREPDSPPQEKRKKVRLACVIPGRDDADHAVLVGAASAVGRDHPDIDVDVRFPVKNSALEQRVLLAELVDAPIDAVCVMPIDPDVIAPEITQLSRAGRLVVTFGCDAPDTERVAYVGPHEDDIGAAAAQAALSMLTPRSSSVVLVGPGGSDPRYGRRYWALKEHLQAGGKAEVLREVNCTSQPWNAADLVRSESRRYPRVACWIFLDDWPLRLDAMTEPLVPVESAIVVCSGAGRHLGRLRRGEIHAVIAYDLRRAVEEAINAATNAVRRSSFGSAGVFLPVEVVTLRNIDTYETHRAAWRRGLRTNE